ncbi:hypothetical protein PG623_08845 [Riemerella anatipestifer]|nr:hypothetical protein [Riemerella anatipestifer]
MNLKYISVVCFLAGSTAYGQVKVNQTISIEGKSNTFLDASENTESKPNSIGRGLLFPQTDLSTFKLDVNAADGVNYPTYFDGMIVYNTKEGGSTTDTNIQTTDNLQKGFYYFSNPTGKTSGNITNGKWVKIGGDSIWQKQSNNDIKLVDGNIESNISYSSVGAFKNVPKVLRNYSKHNPSTQQIETGSIDLSSMNLGNSLNINLGYADKIPVSYVDPLYKEKQLIHNYLLVDEKSDAGVYNRIFGQRNTIATTATTASNYSALYANVNASEHYGKGKINLMIGDYSIATLYDGSADRVVGAYSQASSYTANQTPYMTAAFNYLTPRGTGEVNQLFGTENRIHLNEYSKGTLNAVALNYNQAIITDTWTGKIGRLVGNSTYFNIPTTINSIDEMYGLVVTNVDRGVNKNYAIYTNAGKIHFGDNVGIGVEAPAEKLEVAGNVKATGFIGSNASIFPDYVFQKYYTGTSSIKADYSFKTLSQVEDFVKANGHLPGYQSAEAIKKQGYIDLMATQLTNVEKIEELYLHSIEQDKALKAKDAKIAELEARLQKLEALLVK